MVFVSAWRISLSVSKCPFAWRSSVMREIHSAAVAGTSPRTRRTSRVMRRAASSSASAACRVSVVTASNSSRI